MITNSNRSLRDLYRTLDVPGLNPLRDVHEELDAAVRAAYGMMNPHPRPLSRKERGGGDVLAFLRLLGSHLFASACRLRMAAAWSRNWAARSALLPFKNSA